MDSESATRGPRLRDLWGLMTQEGVGQGCLSQIVLWDATRLMGSVTKSHHLPLPSVVEFTF